MAEPFLGEIRLVGFTFAPRGWADCAGQLLPINQNQSLFSLLGTTYGGDGRTTFALPDLRGRVPLGRNAAHPLGQRGGAETVTLRTENLPAHSHTLPLSNENAAVDAPGAAAVPAVTAEPSFAPGGGETTMARSAATGGGQAHDTTSPYLGMRFVIATQGLFPPRN